MNTHLIRYALAVLLCAATAFGQTDQQTPDVIVLENDLLRIAVSPVGARIVSLRDKIRDREDVKNLPYFGGMNIVRYGKALNLDDTKSRYQLTLSRLADGTQKLTGRAKR